MNNNIRIRFSKDFNFYLPVSNDEDIFLRTLEIRNLKNIWKQYLEDIEKTKDFEKYRIDIKEKIFNKITKTIEFNDLEKLAYSKCIYNFKNYFSKYNNEYVNEKNINKPLYSIDLVNANFQAFKYLSKNLVLGYDTYDELVSSFTKISTIINSKRFRQVLFGMMNPKIQQMVEQYIISQIVDYLINNSIIDENDIVSLSNNEIIISPKNHEYFLTSNSNNIEKKIKELLDIDVKLVCFSISKIGNSKFYKKNIENDPINYPIKTPGKLYQYIFRKLNGLHIIDKDLWYEEDGLVCKFMTLPPI